MDERRHVSWGRLIRRHKLWWPVLPLALVLGFAGFGLYQALKARALERHGVEAVATVTDREIGTTGSGNSRRTRYLVGYSFVTQAGGTVRGREDAGAMAYTRLREGMEVPVRYVPQDPGNHTILPGDERRLSAWIWFGFAAAVLLLTLVYGVIDYRSKSSALRAGRDGAVRDARVDAHHTDTSGFGRRRGPPQHRFRWIDDTGAQGMSEPMSNAAKLPPVGETVRVYIDPRTGKAWWDGDF